MSGNSWSFNCFGISLFHEARRPGENDSCRETRGGSPDTASAMSLVFHSDGLKAFFSKADGSGSNLWNFG